MCTWGCTPFPYLRNGWTYCTKIWCVVKDPLARCFTKSRVGYIWGIPRQIDTAECEINTLHLGFLRNFVQGVIGGPEHTCASFSSLKLTVFALWPPAFLSCWKIFKFLLIFYTNCSCLNLIKLYILRICMIWRSFQYFLLFFHALLVCHLIWPWVTLCDLDKRAVKIWRFLHSKMDFRVSTTHVQKMVNRCFL